MARFATEFDYRGDAWEGPDIEAESLKQAEDIAFSCGLIVVGENPIKIPMSQHTASGFPSMLIH